MQTVSIEQLFREMSNPVFWEKTMYLLVLSDDV